MKKRIIFGFVIACVLGTGLHFLYNVLPNPLTALFAPVNESVWEHMKLLLWPPLPVMLVLSRGAQGKAAYWGAALSSLLLMPVLLLGVYYTAHGAFGIESLVFDIALYVAVLAVGFFWLYRLNESGKAARYVGTLAMLTGVWVLMLVIFTFGAPDLPIFKVKV